MKIKNYNWHFKNMCKFAHSINAGVMELVDMLDLGSSASRRGSSSLPIRTKKPTFKSVLLFDVENLLRTSRYSLNT